MSFPGPGRPGRAGADGCSCGLLLEGDVVDEADAADPRRSGEHETAVEASDLDVLRDDERLGVEHALGGGGRVLTARVGCRARLQRARQRDGRLAVLGGQAGVPRRQREAVVVADGREDADVDAARSGRRRAA